jgi:hypothetical protein
MKLRNLLLPALLLTLAGCAERQPPADPPAGTAQARAAWEARQVRDYRFDFERQCFCVREAVEPVTVEVRSGSVHQVRSRATGEVMPHNEAIPWYTIDELLRQVEEAEREGQEVRVEYHPDGYPVEIEIGSLAADAGVRYLVSNMGPLQ